jgi:hypothetical protein
MAETMEETEATYWKVVKVNEPEMPTPFPSKSVMLTLAGKSEQRTLWGELATIVEKGDFLRFDEHGNPCEIVKPTRT